MTVTMIDSINSPQTTSSPIPDAVLKAQAVGGYSAGNSWQTFPIYEAARPDLAKIGWVVSITLTCVGRGRCYDIESGGGKNENIGVFLGGHADRSHGLPWLYTFASNVGAMTAAAAGFGYHQGRDYYVWAAHFNFVEHICGPGVCQYPKADGTQYSDRVAQNCDGSLLNDYMLPSRTPVDPNAIFPTDVHDKALPNGGNERKTVEQAKGALKHPAKYHNYLKGQVYGELKQFRDRIWRVSHNEPPDFIAPRAHVNWTSHRGQRWQLLNDLMVKIAKL